ncbi:MAG: hypothetical protein AAGI34_17065 [Pseudomonadota bacterium]
MPNMPILPTALVWGALALGLVLGTGSAEAMPRAATPHTATPHTATPHTGAAPASIQSESAATLPVVEIDYRHHGKHHKHYGHRHGHGHGHGHGKFHGHKHGKVHGHHRSKYHAHKRFKRKYRHAKRHRFVHRHRPFGKHTHVVDRGFRHGHHYHDRFHGGHPKGSGRGGGQVFFSFGFD